MKNHYPRKKNSASVPRSRWLAGMVAGQLLGFAVAVAVVAPVVPLAVLVSTLAGGVLGGVAAARLKAKPAEEKPIRAYVFQALVHTSKKLQEMIIKDEFTGAASDSRGMKQSQKPQPRLAMAPPAPPKMGGL